MHKAITLGDFRCAVEMVSAIRRGVTGKEFKEELVGLSAKYGAGMTDFEMFNLAMALHAFATEIQE